MEIVIIIILVSIAIFSIFIYFLKNQEILRNFFKKIKIEKYIKYIIGIILLIQTIIIGKSIIKICNNVKTYISVRKNNEMYEESDKKMEEELITYKNLILKEYKKNNYSNPYIPRGFVHVEGEYNTGYVIEDSSKNQYVWIPCTNKDLEDIVRLEKRNFSKDSFISKDSCYNENIKSFLKSALENGGFYISRYEIGNEDSNPVSKKNVEIWQNVTREEAMKIVEKMNENIDIKCELINGFAYDTTLEWINKTNNVSAIVVDLNSNEKIYSGRNEYNKIFDFTDNILEITTEISYDTVIVRGFSSSKWNDFYMESRYSILKNDNYVSSSDGLAMRTILYK